MYLQNPTVTKINQITSKLRFQNKVETCAVTNKLPPLIHPAVPYERVTERQYENMILDIESKVIFNFLCFYKVHNNNT